MACKLQECTMVPAAFHHTSIQAGKCERCMHNSSNKGGTKRRGRR